MEKKLIFFDVDGTLLDDDKQLPTTSKTALKKLKETGHEVAIATGRSPSNIKDIIEEFDIETYVTFNGQYVVVKNEVIHSNPLDESAIRQLTDIAIKNKHPLVYLDNEVMMANVEYHSFIEECVNSLKVDEMVNYDPSYFENRDIYQSWLICTEEEEAAYTNQFDKLQFFRWHPYATDVSPRGGSKAIGIEAVVRHFGVSPENVYAFGDGLNDLEMLSHVENSVAMGNAPEIVKKAAKYVTTDVSEDGILQGLVRLGLLK